MLNVAMLKFMVCVLDIQNWIYVYTHFFSYYFENQGHL